MPESIFVLFETYRYEGDTPILADFGKGAEERLEAEAERLRTADQKEGQARIMRRVRQSIGEEIAARTPLEVLERLAESEHGAYASSKGWRVDEIDRFAYSPKPFKGASWTVPGTTEEEAVDAANRAVRESFGM